MRYKINIYFTDNSMVFFGACTFSSAVILLNHLLTSEVKSFSISVENDD